MSPVRTRRREPQTDSDGAGSSIVRLLIVQGLRSSAKKKKNPSVKAGVGKGKRSVAPPAAQVCVSGERL